MPLNSEQLDLYLRTKADLENLQMSRLKELIFRSKVRWTEAGEKTTKYFLNLEKARYNAKTSQTIISSEGVLTEQEQFYKKKCRSNKRDTQTSILSAEIFFFNFTSCSY